MTTTFVSRAGDKLAHALAHFRLDVHGKTCADLGASTGGFTDCLLSRGASRVYSIDTGYGVLDWKLRQNPAVIVMERTNALHVQLPEPVSFISIDVGWTPQHLILPRAVALLGRPGDIVSLIKPHYEAPKNWLRGGVLPPEKLEEVIDSVISHIHGINLPVSGLTPSPITGAKGGNIEYLLWIHLD